MRFISFFIFICIYIEKSEENPGRPVGKPALIFDRFTRSLIQLPADVPKDLKCGAWAVACPAETPEEKDFSRKNSFTENALFVRKIYQKGDHAINVEKYLCKDLFKISLVYNVKSFTFQVGFEIYYDLENAKYFHIKSTEDYKSPKEIASNLMMYWNNGKYIIKKIYHIAKHAFGSDIEELWMDENMRMGFVWIHLIKFRLDFSKKIVKKLTYYVGPNSRWPVPNERCENNKLGFELLKDVDSEIYKRTEETLAQNYKLPSDIECKSNAECFERWSLVPMSQFRFGTLTAPICSEMTTIPIWKSFNLKELLGRIDQYLYSLYRAVNEPLHIIVETFDEIEISKRKGFGKLPIFLDPAKKLLPVPKIFFKIVEYRVKNCKLEEKSCWYSALIVIHNDPLFKNTDRLCSKESTEGWGWDELLGQQCEHIYVCSRDKYTKKKLFKIIPRRMPTGGGDLKLSAFPFSNDGETIEPRDVKVDIKRLFDKFEQNGDDLNNENAMIEMKHMTAGNPCDEELVGGEAAGQVEKGESEGSEGLH